MTTNSNTVSVSAIKSLIASDARYTTAAVREMYRRQTSYEHRIGETCEHNMRGWNKSHSNMGTYMGEWLSKDNARLLSDTSRNSFLSKAREMLLGKNYTHTSVTGKRSYSYTRQITDMLYNGIFDVLLSTQTIEAEWEYAKVAVADLDAAPSFNEVSATHFSIEEIVAQSEGRAINLVSMKAVQEKIAVRKFCAGVIASLGLN
jgi:hypothetical protein